jgi:hypothetical protein
VHYSRTRLALKYANRSSYFGSAGLLVVVGVILTPWFVPALVRDVQLEIQGTTTQAIVKNKHVAAVQRQRLLFAWLFAHGGGKRKRCYLSYQFTAGGRLYRRTVGVTAATANAAQVGKPIDVVYLPADPNVSRVGRPMWWTGAAVFPAVGLAACVSAMACVVAGIRDVRRKVNRIAEGVPALGIVDEVDVGYRKSRAYVRSVKYTFLVAHSGQAETRRATLERKIPYKPCEIKAGDAILVVLDALDVGGPEIDCFGARADDKARLLAAAERSHRTSAGET